MLILGADPGTTGALAVISVSACGALGLHSAFPMPLTPEGKPDALLLFSKLQKLRVHRVFLEDVQAFRLDRAMTAFAMGRAVGALEAALSLSHLPKAERIAPKEWQGYLFPPRQKNDGKRLTRAAFSKLFPNVKANDGVRDAALIALAGLMREGVIASFPPGALFPASLYAKAQKPQKSQKKEPADAETRKDPARKSSRRAQAKPSQRGSVDGTVSAADARRGRRKSA